MTTGTVLSVVHDDDFVTAKVRVTEADASVHDYTATVDYPAFVALSTDADRLAMLVTAWNVVRDALVAVEAGVTKISTWNDDPVTLT